MHHNLASRSFSPSLPEFETDLTRLHDIKYLGALEEEHSRDLYLQGAMAVGQIARLLEELCVDETHEDDEEIIDGPPNVSYDTKGSIEAWAHAVELAQEEDSGPMPHCDAEFDAQEDVESMYLNETFVGDIVETFESRVDSLNEQQHTPPRRSYPKNSDTIENTHEAPHIDIAVRIDLLTARLNNLEMDIDDFSKNRCDALTRLELEMAAEENVNTKVHDGIHCWGTNSSLNALGFSLPPAEEEECHLRITRVWTSTATGTSGISVDIPADSEAQPLELEPLRPEDYFWDSP